MSINFETLQGLTIPEGVVAQIEDFSGRVIWSAGEPIALEVEKITSNTYAGETTYENEQFILLDIYPKSANRTVKITYGGLRKTITFSGSNAKQVFFGTFNGVSDSMATPTSGTLTIEGGYGAFGCGSYRKSEGAKENSSYGSCINAVKQWGVVTQIPNNAFRDCSKLTSIILPSVITTIGDGAFSGSGLISLTIPAKVSSIGGYIIEGCRALTELILLPTTPPTLPTNSGLSLAFSASIIVPKGCAEAYKTADIWSKYAEYITEVV